MEKEITAPIREKFGDNIIDWHEHSKRRIYISVEPQYITEVAGFLFDDLNLRFVTATGVETPQAIEIVYHFSFDKDGTIISIRVLIEDKQNPEIESITSVITCAEWIEREIWEMLGVNFKGHPNLKRLLLAEDWPEGEYPLRQKD